MNTPANPPAVVHMDLDGYADICRVHGWRFDSERDWLSETGLRNALEFFSQHKIRASLFTIAQDVHDAAKKARLCEAVGHGHEIGSHSVTHRKLTRLPYEEKRREISDSRSMIEQALAVPVRGFRAPGFDVDAEALRLMEAAGYQYDSSLFPGSGTAKQGGLESVPNIPHALGQARRFVELPMPARSGLPFPFHPSYSLVLGNWYFNVGVRRFRRTGAPLVLLFHLTDFADPVPDEQLPNWKAKVFTVSFLSKDEKLRRCREMLEVVQQHYRIVSTAELLDEWQDCVSGVKSRGEWLRPDAANSGSSPTRGESPIP